ncbi:MAG: 23S rRNA (adenine(2503)-C(2))-methyltransferase RlmN [Bacteroidales bacterium]|nr:23S rRNA (adenine(2503)-C(2))-methyltransferase RlmN [Bacteroidales bacterium]MBP3254831.1 23S rRNA (adenine(2503)-C(2))-methyltransferase RlmN [Bacteroidales bacterium]
MTALLGKTKQETDAIIQSLNAPKFASGQICDWIYKKGVTDIESMSNLSAKLRSQLSSEYCIGFVPYLQELISADGTRKYLFEYEDNTFVEAVLIFDNRRVTLCISCQAGCRMNCAFCATGKQGLKRNLTCHEIINIFACLNSKFPISNIVFMGMGEPLDNVLQVKKSISILTQEWGYGMSARRITVSTAGFYPQMKDFLDSTNVDIALSLHNPIAQERMQIMPIEKAYPLNKIVALLKQYNWTGQRRLTFEYIVFKDLNDQQRHVNALAKLLNGLPCRINLIRFHSTGDDKFKGADMQRMKTFQSMLKAKGFNTQIRASKGEDIMAACGLLSTKYCE